MKTKKLIEQLERYQRWRKGGDIKQPEPFEVTEMLDAAIEALRGIADVPVCPDCGIAKLTPTDPYCYECGVSFRGNEK